MDVYNVYLSTLRYIMNANPEDKSTWCDIFKYIPCLRHMFSCIVCGSILLVPHCSVLGMCLHNVCSGCLGGRMRLRPSCSWCKDYSHFQENKKLRLLILCFKKLCAYISHSNLGAEISKASLNGYGSEVERTIKVLEEAEQFHDNYVLTPPPTEFPHISKSATRGFKSVAGLTAKSAASSFRGHCQNQFSKGKRGRPKQISKLSVKPANSINKHAKKLKKMALNSGSKRPYVKRLSSQKCFERKHKTLPDSGGLLISQRPHRDKSGKSSIGQLWRETFLEEVQPEPYPDSGIEVGNSSDHDHFIHHPQPTRSEKPDPLVNKPEVFRKETRFHKYPEAESKDTSVNNVTSTTNEVKKPRLMLTISKKRYQNFSRKGRSLASTTSSRYRETNLTMGRKSTFDLTNSKMSSRMNKSRSVSARPWTDICRCARFKQPNQLTCFGQKCLCYSDRRACMDCLCNGCKNPIKTSDSAPPLTHVKENDGLDQSFDRSMPRLSPIPQM